MNGEDLKQLLRGTFDSRVFNHGDFNLVYGQPSGTGDAWIIGYRWQPLELLLCPVDLPAVAAQEVAAPPETPPEGVIYSIDLSNVATVADTGTGYQVETVTGFRTWFEVTDSPTMPVTEGPDAIGLAQAEDAEDFHQFMSHFMDVLESYYTDRTHPDRND
ncbi:hypothetical protein [Citricoccus sp. GCM10030269]|uniref:hypothetical protein n=1 Tax=Citricoccus sp. GCM10030269 TaxID=3273388 RepID=UPI00361751D8